MEEVGGGREETGGRKQEEGGEGGRREELEDEELGGMGIIKTGGSILKGIESIKFRLRIDGREEEEGGGGREGKRSMFDWLVHQQEVP